MRRTARLVAIAVLGLGIAAAQAQAQERTPDATIRLTGGSVAAGVGVEWGSGTLTYKGKQHPIVLKGLSVGDVGVRSIEAAGKVYGLKTLADFDGKYTAFHSGITAAEGVGVTGMTNPNGVTVELVSTTKGVELGVGAGGADISIKK